MIFKITIDENNLELRGLLRVKSKELYFTVIGYDSEFYHLDGTWLSRPFALCAWKRYNGWCLQDAKRIFDTAYNVKIEIVNSFPIPT